MIGDNAAAEAHRRRIVESINGRPLPTADTVGASYERDTALERADAVIGQRVTATDLVLALLALSPDERATPRKVANLLLAEFNITRWEPK